MRFPLDLVPPATPPRAARRGSQHERCGHRGAGQGSPPRSAPAGPGLPVTAAVSACTALTRTCSQNLAFQDEGNGSLRVCDPSERLVPRVHHSPGRERTVPTLLALPMTRDGTQRACARGGRASSAAGEGPGADTCDLHAARGGSGAEQARALRPVACAAVRLCLGSLRPPWWRLPAGQRTCDGAATPFSRVSQVQDAPVIYSWVRAHCKRSGIREERLLVASGSAAGPCQGTSRGALQCK